MKDYQKILIASFFIFKSSFGFLGGPFGGPFDGPNYFQNLLTKIESVQQTQNQIKEIKNQFIRMQREAQEFKNNFKQIGNSIKQGNLNSLHDLFYKLKTLQNQTTSILGDYQSLNKDFEKVYLNDNKLQQLYSRNYLDGVTQTNDKLKEIRKETSRVIFDSMKQAKLNPTTNDQANLEKLINASNSSSGTLSAITAGNSILAHMASSLSEVKGLLSQNLTLVSAVAKDNSTVVTNEELSKEERRKASKKLFEEGKREFDRINYNNSTLNIKWR